MIKIAFAFSLMLLLSSCVSRDQLIGYGLTVGAVLLTSCIIMLVIVSVNNYIAVKNGRRKWPEGFSTTNDHN